MLKGPGENTVHMHVHTCSLTCKYILNSGKCLRRKLSRIGRKGAFRGENFCRILTDHIAGCGIPKISWRKVTVNRTIILFMKVFSLESFPLYIYSIHVHHGHSLIKNYKCSITYSCMEIFLTNVHFSGKVCQSLHIL